MRKLIVTIATTLDGYAAGEGGNVYVMPLDGGFSAYNAERLRKADILLAGASTYRGFVDYWPSRADDPEEEATEREISRINNAIRKVVVSDTITSDETAPWTGSTEIVGRDTAYDRIAQIKAEDGGDIIMFGSMTLWNDLIARGLVDELHLMVGPGVIGSGVPTFGAAVERKLGLLDTQRIEDSQLVVLRYAVG